MMQELHPQQSEWFDSTPLVGLAFFSVVVVVGCDVQFHFHQAYVIHGISFFRNVLPPICKMYGCGIHLCMCVERRNVRSYYL